MGEFYVYAYFEHGCADPFYVGKGRGSRAWDHLKLSKRDQHTPFYKKLASLHWEAEVVILEDGMTEDESLAHEIHTIAFYGRRDQGAGCLLNLTDGGDSPVGYHHSAESRKRISTAKLGRKLHLDTGERGRRMNVALALNVKKRKKVVAQLCGMPFKAYESLNSVREDGYSPQAVFYAINRKIEYKELTWEYA